MKAYRPSALPRLFSCPASSERPDLELTSDNEYARMGSAVHEVMATVVREGLTAPPDFHAVAQKWGVKDLDEMAVLSWFGVRTWQRIRAEARVLAAEEPLAYRAKGWKLHGTPDVVCAANDGALLVVDFKSGFVERDFYHQLVAYLFLAARKYKGYERFKVALVWLRRREIEVIELSAADLRDWFQQFKEKRESDACNPGVQCTYCPRGHECDARSKLVRATTNELMTLGDAEQIVTLEMLGKLHDRVGMVEKAAEVARGMIRAAVRDHGPLPLPDGRILDFVERSRDTVYFDKTAPELIKRYGLASLQEVYDLLGRESITVKKDALLDAIGSRAAPRRKGKDKVEFVQALREAGAVVAKKYQVLTPRKELTHGKGKKE